MSYVGGAVWRDTSTYSQSDRVREPWAYELQVRGVRISVHRHRDYPGMWCTCADWAITLPMVPASAVLADAQRMAVVRVRRLCDALLADLAPSDAR